MKTKIVLWGTNDADERILIALALRTQDNKVDIWTFPEKVVTDEFYKQMMREWRDGGEVAFPEENQHVERELSVTESLLPDHIKTEKGDLIQRAQTEWHFIVLSAKLHQAYQSELDEIREKIDALEAFSQDAWDELKSFWDKLQSQVRERNLFRDHADTLRDKTNALFSKMKELRSKLDDEFKSRSEAHYNTFMAALADIEEKIKSETKLAPIFEELKKLQREYRNIKFTREHRTKVWNRIDAAFKAAKTKRFGSPEGSRTSALERLKRRYDGLIAAIEKMEKSIARDRDDLEFQKRKIERTDGQLEAQIRQAKILMIEERVRSKEDKLKEMNLTKAELERKMEAQKKREAKRAEQEAREAAKAAAKAKIAEEIKTPPPTTPQPDAQPEPAEQPAPAEAPADDTEAAKAEPAEAPKESVLEAAGTLLGESLADVVDTVKAVAEVVSDKIEASVEELKKDLEETVEEVKEALQSEEEE
ncbi:MAG: hypothetical protein D6714_15270 [Bacteroidetes bacterium]|nr:MAG: hypothetical protein D6714_15270 [Bacteroidota bacterium]